MKSLKEILYGTGLHPLRRYRVRAVPFGRVSLFETGDINHWKMATHNGMMYFCIEFGDTATTATCEVIDDHKIKQVAQIRIWKRTDLEESSDFAMNSDLLNSVRALAKAHGCNAAIYDKVDQDDMFYMFNEFEDELPQVWIAFDKKPPIFGNTDY